MDWAGIMFHGPTLLHVLERGTVTGVRYKNAVLEPYVCLFKGSVIPDFILMGKNSHSQRAHLFDDFLESEDIHWMDWSPDLNPRPSFRSSSCLKRFRKNNCHSHPPPPPRTIQDLKTTSLNEWDTLPQELISCFVSSMKSRCEGLYICKSIPYPLLTHFLFESVATFHFF